MQILRGKLERHQLRTRRGGADDPLEKFAPVVSLAAQQRAAINIVVKTSKDDGAVEEHRTVALKRAARGDPHRILRRGGNLRGQKLLALGTGNEIRAVAQIRRQQIAARFVSGIHENVAVGIRARIGRRAHRGDSMVEIGRWNLAVHFRPSVNQHRKGLETGNAQHRHEQRRHRLGIIPRRHPHGERRQHERQGDQRANRRTRPFADDLKKQQRQRKRNKQLQQTFAETAGYCERHNRGEHHSRGIRRLAYRKLRACPEALRNPAGRKEKLRLPSIDGKAVRSREPHLERHRGKHGKRNGRQRQIQDLEMESAAAGHRPRKGQRGKDGERSTELPRERDTAVARPWDAFFPAPTPHRSRAIRGKRHK